MPRVVRIRCAGCDKAIDNTSTHDCSNGLFHLFLSTRSMKKISISDSACRKCRWKFDNWKKNLNDEMNDLLALGNINDIAININAGFT